MLEINSLLPKSGFKDYQIRSYIQYLIPKQRNDNGYYAVIVSLFINYNKIAMRRTFKTLPT